MRVDYIRVPGKDWVTDPDSRFDSLELRNPLMKMVRHAQSAILDDMPEAFSLPEGQMQREVNRAIPDRVIREAVVNAVMHRSYRHQQPVQIIRYSNRLEIRIPVIRSRMRSIWGNQARWLGTPKSLKYCMKPVLRKTKAQAYA